MSSKPAPPPRPPTRHDLTHIAPRDKAEILAAGAALHPRFHGKTIVIKYGGNAMTDPALQAGLRRGRRAAQAGRHEPGGGARRRAADRARCSRKLGKKGEFIQGMRVTDDETMEVVEMGARPARCSRTSSASSTRPAARRWASPATTAASSARASCRWSTATTRARSTTSARSARSSRSTRASSRRCRTTSFIPVIAPIGFGDDNENYNINADVVAGKLAEVLKAEKLMLLTNTPGVLDKYGKLLTDLTRARDRRAVRRRHDLRRHAAEDRGRRSTRRRTASTPCTSSTAACRTRCCWRS